MPGTVEKTTPEVAFTDPAGSSKNGKQKNQANKLLPVCEKLQSWRWVIALVTWFGFINQQLMSNAFTMALVCMTGNEPHSDLNVNTSAAMNTSSNSTRVVEKNTEGEFSWDESTQGILLSSSLYLSFLAPAISGFLARRFGSKKVVGITVTCRSLLFLLTPLCARAHLYLLIAVRVLGGGFTNTLTPCTQGLWAHWAPDQEKVQIVAWTKSGVNIGTLVALLISGFLCTIQLDNGWPFVFYVFGGVSAVWSLLWLVLVQNRPEEHRWITERETRYITDNVKAKPDKITKVPYKAILTSRPVLAYFVIQTVHKWCASIYLAYLPKYMRDVLRFEIEENAVVSSLPFASRFLGVIVWEHLADSLASRGISTTTNRKVVQSTGFVMCAALTTATSFVSAENRNIAVGLFVVNMFFQSCTFASVAVLPLDISPRHAGIICGIFQSAGNVITMFGPMTVGFLTPKSTLEQWRSVFYMITAAYLLGVTVFMVFGSAELQPWDEESTASDVEQHSGDETATPSVITTASFSLRTNQVQPPPSFIVQQVSCGYLVNEDSDGGNMNASFVMDDGARHRSHRSIVHTISGENSNHSIRHGDTNTGPKINGLIVHGDTKNGALTSGKSNNFMVDEDSLHLRPNSCLFHDSSSMRKIDSDCSHGDKDYSGSLGVSCVTDGKIDLVPSEYITNGQESVILYIEERTTPEINTNSFSDGTIAELNAKNYVTRTSCQLLRTSEQYPQVIFYLSQDLTETNISDDTTPETHSNILTASKTKSNSGGTNCSPASYLVTSDIVKSRNIFDCETKNRSSIICDDNNHLRINSNVIDVNQTTERKVIFRFLHSVQDVNFTCFEGEYHSCQHTDKRWCNYQCLNGKDEFTRL